MYRQEATEQYGRALKLGQKCHRNDVVHGRYPYPQVLEEFFDESMSAGRVNIGRVEIPMEQIVGTVTSGRKSTFASNFMPLLPPDTEFAHKWINLCQAHLGDEGIHDPIQCVEYMGRFYVQEGNKRVSVMKSYEASTIPGYVTRIVPVYTADPKVQAYYEFMQFYQLSELYQIRFTQPGGYAKLQAALGFDPDHVWSEDERKMFLARYSRFQDFFQRHGGEKIGVTVSDALLVWLRVYTLRELWEMTASELKASLKVVWPDVALLDEEDPIDILTAPQEEPGKNLFTSFFSGKVDHLQAAFFFHASPSVSAFTRSHELGADFVAQTMKDRVTVKKYYDVKADESGEWVMEKAVAEGAQVLIATAPPLIGACRKIAARHPELKVLNCALSMPYTGVRTYYSRVYEGKFITGAVCAAMTKDDTLGYIANYPIYGVPAGINAFALGARMVNPNARVQVEWSCLEGDPYEAFRKTGVKIITNQELPSPGDTNWAWDWGTYLRGEDGSAVQLAAPCWNWGRFYERIFQSILSGAWDLHKDEKKAVGYWWGLDSGVIDVQFDPSLPDGVMRLGRLLRRSIINGSLDPFRFRIYDQQGNLRTDGEQWFSPEQIMKMDWLCDNVDGIIPAFDQIKPISQKLVRVLGVYRDEIPPEKEGVLL